MQHKEHSIASLEFPVCSAHLEWLARVGECWTHSTPVGSQLPGDHVQCGYESATSWHMFPHVDEEEITCWQHSSLMVQAVHTHRDTGSVTKHRAPEPQTSAFGLYSGASHAPPASLSMACPGHGGPRKLSAAHTSKPVPSPPVEGHTLCTRTTGG